MTLAAATLGAGSARALPPAPPEFYGVSPSTGLRLNEFQRFSRANIGTVRVTFYWPAVQRNAGQEHFWNAVDGSVINASYAGIRLLPTLIGSPKHISNDPFRPPLDSESERRQWQGFVRGAVKRYGPNGEFWQEVYGCNVPRGHCLPDLPYRPLRVWQAWNEPNLGIFWRPTPSPERYGELLRLTSAAVHDVDPGAEVINGGIMPGGPGAKNSIPYREFIARLYRVPGVAGSFDGLDLHPYKRRPRGVRRMVKRARRVIAAHGDAGKPLWISEVGWSTRGPKDDDQVTTRKRQAKRLSRTFRMLTRRREAWGVRLASWFTYRDASFPAYCDWCPGAGLFNRQLKPKPAWRKYVKVTGGKKR